MSRPIRRRLLQLAGLCLVLIAPFTAAAHEPDDENRSWFDVETPEHAGLLGKRYVAGRYAYLAHGDTVLNRIDRGFDGYSVGLNHPILQPDPESWLGIDLFASAGTFGLGGAAHFPPSNVGIQLENDVVQSSIGTSLYADPLEPVRPLVQVGAVFSREQTLVLVDGFGGTSVDYDTNLLLRAGVEADLNAWLAVRTVVDINVDGAWEDSSFLGDAILWPTDRCFFRGGVIAPLGGQEIGGHVGVGVTF